MFRRIVFILVMTATCVAQFHGRHARCEENSDEHASQHQDGALTELPISDEDRGHWSFKPLVRPTLPSVQDSDWARNEIDLFILRRLEDAGLVANQEAKRSTLIRRVTFDLTGLPPTPLEVDAFVNDPDPRAYDHLVESLLGSHSYGLRWAQHWLDLARFAETDGFEHDKVRAEAWRFRDWVIEALNSDMPYDEFLRMQVSGDERTPGNDEALVATYFCVAGPDMPDINLMDERRHNLLNEMTSTVGEVFLGLQVGCAQCHDHMYDPISQADFYRLRSFFEGSVQLEKNKSVKHLTEMTPEPPPSYLMIRGDFRRKGPSLEPDFLRIANHWEQGVSFDKSAGKSSGRRSALVDWMVDSRNPLTARVIVNRAWQFHFGKGLCRTPSDFGTMGLEPSHAELLDWLADDFIKSGWSLKHLHRKIVGSATFRQAGNASYQGQGAEDRLDRDSEAVWDQRLEADPRNLLLSRFPQIRLNGETIRDAMLSITGSLNEKMGGPSVRPPLPEELRSTLLKKQWEISDDEDEHYRRSIYIFVRRNLRYPIFEAFDRPDANASCARRSVSTTAPQSLLLLNSDFSLEMSRRLAGKIISKSGDRKRWISDCFIEMLGRAPSSQEQESLLTFIDRQTELIGNQPGSATTLALPIPMPETVDVAAAAALTDVCLALFNSNEFIYVD